jgi:hypothetical protein
MISAPLAFFIAGSIGSFVSVVHGILIQRNIVGPFCEGASQPASTRRLLAVLMQFSTFCWFLGGVGLMVAPQFSSLPEQSMLAKIVALFYIYGALGNFWATKGRHPGWILLAISVGLILYGLWVM